MTRTDDELEDAERFALAGLRQDADPPPELEASVVADLRRRGLLRPAGSRRTRGAVPAAAAAVIAFALGIAVGLASRRPSSPALASGRYVLLLEGADTPSAQEEARRVDEYRAWARKEAGAGRLVSGEKLEPWALALGAAAQVPAGGETVRGFFIIAARDDAEALAIAQGCPHLLHGGRVIVRKIGKT